MRWTSEPGGVAETPAGWAPVAAPAAVSHRRQRRPLQPTGTSALRILYLILAAVTAGTVIAFLPPPPIKLATVLVVAGMTSAFLLARRGLVLDPAWVVVTQLYAFVPVRGILLNSVEGFSTVSAVSLVFLPFTVAALLISPAARTRALLLLPLGLLGLMAAASLAWTPALDEGSWKLTVWLVNGLLPAAAVVILYAAKGSISWRLILAFAIGYAAAMLLFGSPWEPGSDRQSLFGQNPIWAARAVVIGAIVATFGPFPMWARVMSLPIAIAAALLTGSLGPVVGLIVGVAAGVAGSLRDAAATDRRTILGWTTLMVVLGLGTVLVLSGALAAILSPLGDDPSNAARAGLVGESLPLFLRAPIVGIGMGAFGINGSDLYPHNLPAEVAVEMGIIGLLLLALWTLLALMGAVRSPLLLALVATTGTYTLFSGSLAGQTEFWMLSAVGVAGASRALSREPLFKRQGPPGRQITRGHDSPDAHVERNRW